MKQVYQAVDTKLFDTLKECNAYELELGKSFYKLYDSCGNITEKPDEAYFIFIDSEGYPNMETGSLGAMALMKDFHDVKEKVTGIDEECTGWFYWDELNWEYHWISETLIQGLKAIELPKSDVSVENEDGKVTF